ncbi:conjugative transposon protein TraM [Mucilaginibacter robiniae]|uniref:Conjugative transposon protein TraM n=1 Tax=Mucilaginibacter robiniae TaxID=2728022 RepID=A0A7L5E535_9SPHI|nr:conjugative transposon protein TraM [Mucilaginibacter robiniae]QJD95943.1 conjugative transposon protein TraM [Mucilaginibacter robiniae]
MNINFKQPKFVLPLLILPFLCLFFYVWHSAKGKPQAIAQASDSLNTNVGSVSGAVRKKELTDKLDAYRNTFKGADGLSAVAVIPSEKSGLPTSMPADPTVQQRKSDSIQQLLRVREPDAYPLFSGNRTHMEAPDISAAVAAARQHSSERSIPNNRPADPMEVFRQQMSIMDSVTRQNDPAFKEEQRKKQLADQLMKARESLPRLTVSKVPYDYSNFNTVVPESEASFITAVIDENVTGYAGSRIRLKLLDNIQAGGQLIPKDTYLYAQMTGFSGQRVALAVTSILVDGKILPVRLDIYDQDGLPGLYVPASAFRDFSKDLGGSSVQGVTLDGGSGSGQFMMSTLDKFFQSTSSAIAGIIRKNKAKLKFNSFIYLIDPDALQKAQKTY